MASGVSAEGRSGGTWVGERLQFAMEYTWWIIPLSKWVISPVINGTSRVNPLK